jgi:hypothetical protein
MTALTDPVHRQRGITARDTWLKQAQRKIAKPVVSKTVSVAALS